MSTTPFPRVYSPEHKRSKHITSLCIIKCTSALNLPTQLWITDSRSTGLLLTIFDNATIISFFSSKVVVRQTAVLRGVLFHGHWQSYPVIDYRAIDRTVVLSALLTHK